MALIWSSSALWEGIEYGAEALVVICAFIEVLADFELVLKGEDRRALRKSVEKRAAIGLVVGLVFGLGALVRTNSLFADAITSAYNEARNADSRAEKASKQATAAVKHGEDLESEAAALRARTEHEIDARLALEKQLRVQGPRWLLLQDATPNLVRELAPFAGQRVSVFICGPRGTPDDETVSTWRAISTILFTMGAKWKKDPEFGGDGRYWDRCSIHFSLGVLVFVSSVASTDTKKAANTLGSQLSKTLLRPIEETLLLQHPKDVEGQISSGSQTKTIRMCSRPAIQVL